MCVRMCVCVESYLVMSLSRFVFVASLFALCVAPCFATKGLDLSVFQGDVPQSAWNCLKSNGYSFAIVQALQSNGNINPYAVGDIQRAHAAGITYVDAYLFLNFRQDPETQVENTINHLRSGGAAFGMVWFDIEAASLWGSCAQNQAYFTRAVNKANAMGAKVGIYTSASQWAPIACGWTGLSGYPLWYAHYDNNPSFSDFAPFGGWSRPAIKQYMGTTGVCGTSIDMDWYP